MKPSSSWLKFCRAFQGHLYKNDKINYERHRSFHFCRAVLSTHSFFSINNLFFISPCVLKLK
jgi:hypothetical protein